MKRVRFLMKYRAWCGEKATLNTIATRMEAVTGHKPSMFAISKWFHGKTNPTPDNVERLAATFEVTESWLMFGE